MEIKRTDSLGDTQVGTLWKHVKSGGIYTVFATCQIEATNEPGILYHSVEGKGPLWCRPFKEFLDGRFMPVEINNPNKALK
ncbi:DUF1653 domain-containing protein [Flexibacterium corallicola]|uniref:DUF1653 domain-containing protein n=1 Tax=Flexibacterium corallicola TaxID=3037259 RepID=UPI00286EFA5C|nr:DUF1653 domain-containing protein [Pseudovibrio sp. M1P-2-3]